LYEIQTIVVDRVKEIRYCAMEVLLYVAMVAETDSSLTFASRYPDPSQVAVRDGPFDVRRCGRLLCNEVQQFGSCVRLAERMRECATSGGRPGPRRRPQYGRKYPQF